MSGWRSGEAFRSSKSKVTDISLCSLTAVAGMLKGSPFKLAITECGDV